MEKLKKHIHDDSNGLDYVLVGDYYIPDLRLPEESRPIGRWGRMHREYLQEYCSDRYNELLLSGKLWTYLADLDEQAQSQLKAIYKDNADTIIGNMDTSIFLGGKEPTTLKELAAVLGKETIDTYNTGESRGRETSHSLNYQKLGKELMSQDELAVMDGGKCILQLRGVRPFLSDKYDITKHPNFEYTADADDKNAFDIEAFLSARLKLKPNEVCDVYEVDTKGA